MSSHRGQPELHEIIPAGSTYTHGEHLQKRLDFISYIVTNCVSVNLTIPYFTNLWASFVIEANCEADSNMFFAFITKKHGPKHGPSTNRQTVVPNPMILEIFEAFFCDPDFLPFDALTPAGFKCFLHMFRKVNYQKQNIEIQPNKSIKRKAETLIG